MDRCARGREQGIVAGNQPSTQAEPNGVLEEALGHALVGKFILLLFCHAV